MMNDGEDVTRLASMCKLKAGRLAREVADTCLQVHIEFLKYYIMVNALLN